MVLVEVLPQDVGVGVYEADHSFLGNNKPEKKKSCKFYCWI